MRIRGLELDGGWSTAEIRAFTQALKPLPSLWVERNPCFKRMVRQPVLTNAPASAPGHSKYEPPSAAIVVFDKGVYHGEEIDQEQFRRSIYHELAHSLIAADPELLARWKVDTRRDGVVDDYARTSPDEDFADSFSEFFLHRDQTRRRIPIKTAFLQRFLDQAGSQEKTAMFIDGFADEMTKIAKGGLSRMLRRNAAKRSGRARTPRMPGGRKMSKGLALAGGSAAAGAAAGGAFGTTAGKKKGYSEGTGDVMQVAQRARLMGRKEGVLAYHRALMQHRRKAQG